MKHICLKLLIGSLLIVSFLSPSSASAAASSITNQNIEQTVDALMKSEMEKFHIPGAAVVVTQGENIVFSKGYGHADIEQQTPFDPAKTIIRAGSLPKSLTATAVMQLVEQGKLALDEDINKYLKTYQIARYMNYPIMLHHLLTHTAGLDDAIYQVNASSQNKIVTTEHYFSNYYADKQPPVRQPGTQYKYSNAAIGLAGNIIEQVTGQSLNDYMTEHLFQPLDMPSAVLALSSDKLNLAKSYHYEEETGYEQVPYRFVNLPSAGELSVVPNDFSHYLIAHLNDGKYKGQTILQPESIAKMHATQFTPNEGIDGVGYGFFEGELANGEATLSHTGEVDSFVSLMVLVPTQRLGIYVVTNNAQHGTELHNQLVQAITGLLPLENAKNTPQRAAITDNLAQLEGHYVMSIFPQHGWGKWLVFLGGPKIEVEAAEDHLTVTGVSSDNNPDGEPQVYIPVNTNYLFQEEGGQQKIWFKQELGQPWQIVANKVTTMTQTTVWSDPQTSFLIYIGGALLWLILFIISISRYIIRSVRKKTYPISGHILAISAIFTVFLPIQFLYGSSELVFGYPGWFTWGVSSLPLIAIAVALHLVVRTFINGVSGDRLSLGTAWSNGLLVLITFLYTFFLFYWNFLSIHFT